MISKIALRRNYCFEIDKFKRHSKHNVEFQNWTYRVLNVCYFLVNKWSSFESVFSFTASVINLFFQEKAEARVSGVRYFNFAILMLVLYALITLNPYALYKYFTKKRKRPKDGSKPKKKRIRVLNYEPIPDYTEQKTSRSEKSSNTSESS